jgi:cation diffusion facilitator family transporter
MDAYSATARPARENRGYREAIRVTWVGIVVIVVLGAGKVIGGLLTHSSALVADGFESAADAGVSLAAIVGFWIARRPADRDHPYGHGKAEVLSAVIIAWVMVLVAIGMAAAAAYKMFEPGRLVTPEWQALLFLAGTVVVAEGLYRYKMWQGNRLNSAALRAEAYDHRKDMISSAIAIVAVALAVLLPGAAILDPIAALITCAFIGWMALRIMREATPQLMDKAVSGSMLDDIRRLAEQVPNVQGTEKLVARRSGLDVIVELHVEVDPTMSVTAGHDVASDVRDRITAAFESVTDVLVHVEPFYRDDHVNS